MKDSRYLEFKANLEKCSLGLSSVNGFNKLKKQLNGVSNWEEFQAIRAQINVTCWFKDRNILKEIEPDLPHRKGSADILLVFSNHDIYCEVNSLESFAKVKEPKEQNADIEKIKIKSKNLPWLTELDIEHAIKRERIIRNLKEETNKQLPLNYPGILALETGRAAVFSLEVKEIATKLFKNRHQVILIMLWSLEKGSKIGEAPFWFVNPSSRYQNVGQELLRYLGQGNNVFDC